uniref:Toc64 family protein n=1 Tax=Rhizophora mucronata TaxID=61149 RepID=A0A2P2LTA4_RHIMU
MKQLQEHLLLFHLLLKEVPLALEKLLLMNWLMVSVEKISIMVHPPILQHLPVFLVDLPVGLLWLWLLISLTSH